MGHDSCCEILGSVCYILNRKIDRLSGSSQFVVSYHGAAISENLYENRSVRVDIPDVFVVDGTVEISEMSLQQDPRTGSPILIDVIGVQIASDNKKHQAMLCLYFYQELSCQALRPMLNGPALLFYMGPTCEAPLQRCQTFVQARVSEGCYSQHKIQTRKFRWTSSGDWNLF